MRNEEAESLTDRLDESSKQRGNGASSLGDRLAPHLAARCGQEIGHDIEARLTQANRLEHFEVHPLTADDEDVDGLWNFEPV